MVFFETAVIADWIFAIEYFEVALKLPLLVHPDDPSIQAKRAKIKWAIWTLNTVFYASVLTYSILLQLYVFSVFDDKDVVNTINYIATVLTFAPTVLLLIAVACVHCVVSKLRSSAAVFEKERLIKIHALLYSLQFLFYLAENVL